MSHCAAENVGTAEKPVRFLRHSAYERVLATNSPNTWRSMALILLPILVDNIERVHGSFSIPVIWLVFPVFFNVLRLQRGIGSLTSLQSSDSKDSYDDLLSLPQNSCSS